MKENLKVNLIWLAFLLAGFGILQGLVAAGVLNFYYVQIVQQIGINIILAVGLNLIVGFSGQFSLGHAGFMAIGAYSVGIIGKMLPSYGGFAVALIVGMVLAGLVALLVGLPTLRLKGDYLAIATLGVAEIIRILIINGGQLTNGAAGIMSIPLFTNWQLVYVFVVITTILTVNFLRSPIGRSTISVREDEIAAESVGVNPTAVKVTAFVIGAMTAAIAGGLHAGYVGTIVPKDFAFMAYHCSRRSRLYHRYFRGCDCLGYSQCLPQELRRYFHDYLFPSLDSPDDFPSRWTFGNQRTKLFRLVQKEKGG